MATPLELSASVRSETGRHVHAVRRRGEVPAILYGHNVKPQNIAIEARSLQKVWHGAGHSHLVDLALDGGRARKVLIRELQINPRTMEMMHVDLFAVNLREKLIVEVPLIPIGESPAVTEFKLGVLAAGHHVGEGRVHAGRHPRSPRTSTSPVSPRSTRPSGSARFRFPSVSRLPPGSIPMSSSSRSPRCASRPSPRKSRLPVAEGEEAEAAERRRRRRRRRVVLLAARFGFRRRCPSTLMGGEDDRCRLDAITPTWFDFVCRAIQPNRRHRAGRALRRSARSARITLFIVIYVMGRLVRVSWCSGRCAGARPTARSARSCAT